MKISIITVSYNSENYIASAIESVLSQTYSDIEYIIIDGGSKDNTVNIIKKFEPEFNGRMRWISEKDNGLYDAMNKGIRLATGDVIGLINN
jgi:glycosyltransferase involved in cell wall biosynthesis